MSPTVDFDRPMRKTWAVTVAGLLFLLAGLAFASRMASFMFADFSRGTVRPPAVIVWLILGCADLAFIAATLAIVRRWRGWRVWAGIIAWSAIALASVPAWDILASINDGPSTGAISAGLSLLALPALAGFLLWAKRREPPAPAADHLATVAKVTGIGQLVLAILCALDALRIGAQLADIPVLEDFGEPLPSNFLLYLLGGEIVLAAWLAVAGLAAVRQSERWRKWTATSAALIIVGGAVYAWMRYCADDLFTAGDATRHLPLTLGVACFLLWASRTRNA